MLARKQLLQNSEISVHLLRYPIRSRKYKVEHKTAQEKMHL